MADLTFPELQQKMQIEKEQKQGVKYPFRTAEDIYNKFKKLDSGWSVSFPEDDIQVIKDKIYYKAVAVAKKDSDGALEKAIGWAREEDVPIFNTQKGAVKQMQDPQWTGAVSSYARKYALQGLFAIGGEDVDDYPAEENQAQAQAAQQNNQSSQVNDANQSDLIDNDQYKAVYGKVRVWAQLKNATFDQVANYVLQRYEIRDFHDIPEEHFETVMNYLNGQILKAQGQNYFNNL